MALGHCSYKIQEYVHVEVLGESVVHEAALEIDDVQDDYLKIYKYKEELEYLQRYRDFV